MISDEQLVAYCVQELTNNNQSGDLAAVREKALDYYQGDVSDYLTAPEDRSSIVTRDVLDTIESVLPSLIKIFIEEDNAIEFLATSQQDEAMAKLETDAVRSVFFRENDGFLNLYTFCKDALLSKVGIFKVYWEDYEWEREEYEGLDEIEAAKILSDPRSRVEVEEYEIKDDGTIDLVVKVQKKQGKVCVETVTPEEFGVSSDSSSPNVKDDLMPYQTTKKTLSELRAMGFDEKVLDEIANMGEESFLSSQQLARRTLSDEQETSHAHKSMRKVWVTECYPLIDRNEDGVAERLKVTLIGPGEAQYTSLKLLDVDEARVPFSAATPVILTHKFHGYSLADLVMDIQEIRTTLFRGILDNMYLANNVRMGANENVNLDDLLTSRPGGIVRTAGTTPPGNHLTPIVHPAIPGESFGLLEVLDDMLKNRTGVGDEVAGLDSSALANINTGVIAQAYDQARMRIELMARILAEVGLKECFKDIRHELHANQSEAVQFKINNQWVDVDPRAWADDRRVKINVGIGNHSKMQKRMALDEVLMLQEKAMQMGLMEPSLIHNTLTDKLQLNGLDVNRYFPPANFQPPPKQPDPKLMIEAERVKIEKQRADNENQRSQMDAQLKMMMAQSKEREMQIKSQMEQLKGELQLQKMAVDEQSQIMRAQTENTTAQVNNEIRVRDQDLKESIAAQKAWIEERMADIKKYEADLKASSSLEEKVMEIEQKSQSDVLKYLQNMQKIMADTESKRRMEREKIINHLKVNGTDRSRSFVESIENE